MKEEIFISSLAIILLFNVFVVAINPTESSILNMDMSSVLVTAIAIITGGSVLSIVLGETVIKVVFATLVIFNILFQIDLYGFTVGLGLTNTLFTVFQTNDVLNLGFITASVLSLMVFFSGMLIVVESA